MRSTMNKILLFQTYCTYEAFYTFRIDKVSFYLDVKHFKFSALAYHKVFAVEMLVKYRKIYTAITDAIYGTITAPPSVYTAFFLCRISSLMFTLDLCYYDRTKENFPCKYCENYWYFP